MNKMSIAFKVLCGSYNYHLNTEKSDKDYKTFFYPSFDQLYSGQKYSKSEVSDTEDNTYHDIRKFPDMLWKSNVNFIETLFSVETPVTDNLYDKLKIIREDIARMNLPYLYDGCFGMFYRTYKQFQRDKDNPEKYYKHAYSSIRILDFIKRYRDTKFKYFGKAIDYEKDIYNNEQEKYSNKKLFIDIKSGKYSYQDLEEMIECYKMIAKYLKNEYKSYKPSENLHKVINEWVKQAVRERIKRELIEN
jgi:predicted nucleotidyltransferase